MSDIERENIFSGNVGVGNVSETVTTRLQEYDGTYYGDPSNAQNLIAIAYSGGIFIELIQPVSGNSIFKDYVDNHPIGGVQHVAYSTSIDNLGKVTSDFEGKGLSVISNFDTAIAKIVFFDTRKEIGVFTEIMGITEEGEKTVKKMKSESV